jgi:hypothetical protein
VYGYLFFAVLVITTFLIAWQDFKERLVSLWVLLLYLLNNALQVFFRKGSQSLLENTIGTLCYFGICFLVLFVYYYLKEKRVPKIIDAKIGMADVLVLAAIGVSLPVIVLIPFFTIAFIISALAAMMVLKDKQAVPLAGMLVILYFIFTILDFFTDVSNGFQTLLF